MYYDLSCQTICWQSRKVLLSYLLPLRWSLLESRWYLCSLFYQTAKCYQTSNNKVQLPQAAQPYTASRHKSQSWRQCDNIMLSDFTCLMISMSDVQEKQKVRCYLHSLFCKGLCLTGQLHNYSSTPLSTLSLTTLSGNGYKHEHLQADKYDTRKSVDNAELQ